MFFDPRRAKLLGAGEHLVIDGCQGLRLVATKTKKTWTYRYKAKDGRMKQVAIGQWPEVSVQAVAAKWQAMRHSRNKGIDPVAERYAKKLNLQRGSSAIYSVRNLVDDYIEGHLEINRKVTGALAAKRQLLSVLEADPNFARMTADSVTRADAFNVIDTLKGTPTAAQKIRSLFGAGWDYALDSGRLDGNVPNWWRVWHHRRGRHTQATELLPDGAVLQPAPVPGVHGFPNHGILPVLPRERIRRLWRGPSKSHGRQPEVRRIAAPDWRRPCVQPEVPGLLASLGL